MNVNTSNNYSLLLFSDLSALLKIKSEPQSKFRFHQSLSVNPLDFVFWGKKCHNPSDSSSNSIICLALWQNSEISILVAVCFYSLYLMLLLWLFLSEFYDASLALKTRMMMLPDSGKSLSICTTVFTQKLHWADGQKDGWTEMPYHYCTVQCTC